jgi:hypothetical protein
LRSPTAGYRRSGRISSRPGAPTAPRDTAFPRTGNLVFAARRQIVHRLQ